MQHARVNWERLTMCCRLRYPERKSERYECAYPSLQVVYILSPVRLVVLRPQPNLTSAIVRFQGSSVDLRPPLCG